MSRQDEEQFAEWLKEHRVGEVECLVADMAGIARGKILPTNKFLSGLAQSERCGCRNRSSGRW